MKILKLQRATKTTLKDLNALLSQLSQDPAKHNGTLAELRDIVRNKRAVMIVAQEGKRIVGVGSLYTILNLGRKRGEVEDVVVDSAYRGQGLGEKIMRALIRSARKQRLVSLHLTSRSARVAANKLYQKLGFVRKETNVYRLKL